MYKARHYHTTKIETDPRLEGETIETKVERIVSTNEPISDGAPLIYTERKDGVQAGYNIRTDRWEIAADAMDTVQRSIQAKRDEKFQIIEGGESDKVESIGGTKD